jgi:hypothetical protein
MIACAAATEHFGEPNRYAVMLTFAIELLLGRGHVHERAQVGMRQRNVLCVRKKRRERYRLSDKRYSRRVSVRSANLWTF